MGVRKEGGEMMRKILVLFIVLILLFTIKQEIEAVGAGGTIFIDQFEVEEGQWSYNEGFSPYIALNAKYNDNLFFSLSGMKSSHQADDKYKLGEKELTIKSGELDYLQILLNAKYNFRANKTLQPFIIAGAGSYKFDFDIKAETNDPEANIKAIQHQVKNELGFGANLAMGMDFKIRENLLIGLDGRYNYIISDYYQGGAFNLIFDISYGFR